MNVDSATFYDAQTNRLKPQAELASLAATLPDGPAVAYCNTGHWAATDWFVLSEILGRSGRAALLRLDGRLDLGREPSACLRAHQVG